jgi:hypothetical protein
MDKKDNNSIKVIDYEENTQSELILEPLDKTVSGNIAMVDTNGLTAGSFKASTTYSIDSPQGAFDGWAYNENLNVGGIRKDRGIWISNLGHTSNQWISIDFGKTIDIKGFKIVQYSGEFISSFPKNIIVQSSVDGIVFVDQDSFLLTQSRNITKTITSLQSRYFRIFFVDNYGHNYISIGDMEIYQ